MKDKFNAINFFTKHLINIKKKLTNETTFGDLEVISSVRPKPLRQVELANNVVKFIRERDNYNKKRR
jgi:hypothetical protein|tara:strand:- start:308 stop:508 length:201 start_codon:yes stop_codon:yes gene_type:complete